MMHHRFRWSAVFSCLVLVVGVCAAQQPVTGLPQFGSFQSGVFDTVNLANLNVHFSIPIFSRSGKGIPLAYSLIYDGLVWTPVTSGSTTSWQPSSSWGWTGQGVGTTGWLSYPTTTVNCYDSLGHQSGAVVTMGPYTYYEPSGTGHPIPNTLVQIFGSHCSGNPVNQFTAMTSDNSGFNAAILLSGPNTVTTKDGVLLYPPTSNSNPGNGVIALDGNGNQISFNGGTFTDTLGTALTVSGGPPSSTVYSYAAPSGATANVTVNYHTYTVTTQFNVSGIVEYSASGIQLVDSIVLPDGSKYQFLYEQTGTGQRYTGGGIGPVTGRLAQVTLPTGGAVVYTYSTSTPMMADGSPSTLTRTFGGGTWTYSRVPNPSLPQAWTTMTDPVGNVTDIYFSGIYLTAKSVYKGARVTNLDYSYICYNGIQTGCITASVASPVSSRSVYDYPSAGSLYSRTDYSYDSYGSLIGEHEYDFGTGTNASLRATTVVNSANVNASNHSLCTNSNICNLPASIQITDGVNQKAYATYAYDTHGNTTTISHWTGGGSYLNQGYTYNTGGTLATSTDPNGTQTTYSYAGTSCNNTFPTSVTVAGLTTQYAYNCTGGVVTSVQDPNGATTSTSYSDPYFWRPASTTDPLNNTTTFSYASPTQFESTMNFNGGSSTTDVLQLLDGFGRTLLQQKSQGPGASAYDTVIMGYDSSGRLASQTQPYSSSQWSGGSGGPQTTWTYDALGRPLLVTDPGSGTTGYTYSQNDVLVTVGPGQSFSKQNEYDALGRLKSVCEITSAGGSGTCSQQNAPTGLFTAYGYDPLGNLITVAQSGQSRSFTYDGLSRMVNETHPETSANGSGGTTTYYYDSGGSCIGSNGDMVKRVDPAGNATCYTYDGLHRLTSATYPTGTDSKYYVYDSATAEGFTISNPKGRLVEGYTKNSSAQINSREVYSYDVRGQATDYYQQSANSGGWYHVQQSYAANGSPVHFQGFAGSAFSHAFDYTPDGEGRPVGLSDETTGYAAWCCTTYNAAGQPSLVQVGATVENFQYDSNTGRMTQWQSSALGVNQTGNLTWNANGTLNTLNITDGFNSANRQTCSYGYDDLARLTSAHCGTGIWNQDFTYDVFGNINKSGSVNFSSQGGTGNHAPGLSYDNNGDVTNDGSTAYSYDAGGRPVSVGGVQIVYDAFNRAVEQNRSGAYTQVVYSPTGSKFAYMSGQTLQKYMVPLAGGVQSVYTGASVPYIRNSDWLGSSRLALNWSGSLYSDRAYGPFGETYSETGTVDRSFTGQTQDVIAGATGIYDFLFRQHSSSQGRWLMPDPAGLAAVDMTNPQTWNRYAYVANNPLRNIDRLGLDCTTAGGESCGDSGTPFISVTVSAGFGNLFGMGALGAGMGGLNKHPIGNEDNRCRFCIGGFKLKNVFAGPPAQDANMGKNCPTVPAHPGYGNINANMDAAKSAPLAIYSFYNTVKNHGPWDYKQAKNLNDFGQIIPQSPFEDFGNFNYGATANSLGLPLSVALRGAGYAGVKSATGSTWDAIKAALGSSPYGDDPHDQEMIINGYNFSEQGCQE